MPVFRSIIEKMGFQGIWSVLLPPLIVFLAAGGITYYLLGKASFVRRFDGALQVVIRLAIAIPLAILTSLIVYGITYYFVPI